MRHIHAGFLKLAVTAGMLLWTSMAVTPAMAAPLTFNFTGVIGGDSPLVTALSFPQPLSATYTIDFDSSSGTTGNNVGGYDGAIKNLTINIGSTYTAQLTPGINFIDIQQFPNPGGYDDFSMRAHISGAGVPGTTGMFTPSYFYIDFIRPPGIFGNASTQPNIGGIVGSANFRVVFDKGLGTNEIHGTGNTSPVPLPPAMILFGAGLAALIGLGARNWQKQGSIVA